jgi:hypothetical protein
MRADVALLMISLAPLSSVLAVAQTACKQWFDDTYEVSAWGNNDLESHSIVAYVANQKGSPAFHGTCLEIENYSLTQPVYYGAEAPVLHNLVAAGKKKLECFPIYRSRAVRDPRIQTFTVRVKFCVQQEREAETARRKAGERITALNNVLADEKVPIQSDAPTAGLARRQTEQETKAPPGSIGNAYSGPNYEWVRRLLQRAGHWSCPSPAPTFQSHECVRDSVAAAALNDAWAAECYAEQHNNSAAKSRVADMMKNLHDINTMCGSADSGPNDPSDPCPSKQIYWCGELPMEP